MVVVQVRDQHGVEHPGIGGHRDMAAQMRDATAEDRVGQQAGPPQLQQHGRVAEPDEAAHARCRRSSMTAAIDAAPTITEAAAKSQPTSAKEMPMNPNCLDSEVIDSGR